MDEQQFLALSLFYSMEPLVTITKSKGGPVILLQQGVGHSKHLMPFKLLFIPVLYTHKEFPGNMAELQGLQRVECLLELQFPNHLESQESRLGLTHH